MNLAFVERFRQILFHGLSRAGEPKNPKPPGQLDLYKASILALAASRDNLSVAIIGANDGKYGDPFYQVAADNLGHKLSLLLVEPQSALIPLLEINYAFVPDKHIFVGAVGLEGHANIYTVKKNYWNRLRVPYGRHWPVHRAPSGIASMNRKHVEDWLKKHLPPPATPSDAIDETVVEVRDLRNILERHSMRLHLDLLQVDVEGFDDEVLYSCNLEQTQPSIIHFEQVHLSAQRRVALSSYLVSLGYQLFDLGKDALAIRVS